MKYLLIIALFFLAACSKNIDQQSGVTNKPEIQGCDFGITTFNLSKRPASYIDEVESKNPRGNGGNGGGGSTGGGGGTVTVPSNTGVILLDFNGQMVTGTPWNSMAGGDINCAPSNLTSTEISLVVQRVTNDYSPFNVVVTTDETVYNAANIYKRTRVIITESWEWYGQAGGVAFLNTFTSGTNTPCFVFSSLLSYNSRYVGEAAAHEAGHTLGLYHQSSYDVNCTKLAEYNIGQGSGEIGWAPIMGNSYYQNLSLWHNGPNAQGCSQMQDDVAIISSVTGLKTDDYSNSFSGAAILSSSVSGVISSTSDVDFFSLNLSSARTVNLVPFNVGSYNAGADLDMIMNIYSSAGELLYTFENPVTLNAVASLAAGSYFVSVGTISNTFTSNYGMLGKYSITVN